LVDFGDLEHYALEILMDNSSAPGNIIPSPVALELKEHYVEIFVDEYQDINSVQETILQLVSREASEMPNNMFMVGDVKQSIYRFRLADPSLFMGKYMLFPREEGKDNQGIDLAKNFRSRQEVVDAVNYIFRQIMTPSVGEMTYDKKAELVCGAAYPNLEGFNLAKGPVEVHLLEKTLSEDSVAPEDEEGASFENLNKDLQEDSNEGNGPSLQEQLLELNAAQREARIIGKRILAMVQGTPEKPQPECYVFDKHTGYRPVQYRDIVILLRATREIANVYIEEFRQLGIPGFADLGSGYFAATEVETMMSLLKIIDNPRHDIPLAGVLRSPICGLKAEDLAEIRAVNPQGDFYQCLIEVVTNEETSELAEKLVVFLAKLDYWRTLARQGSLGDLIWNLYNDTGYYAYVGAMPGGAQRQANLRALYERAIQYESTSFRGLFRFLRFVEKFLDSGSDLGAARALGENEDVVRIMSIHKSKGLEFPVVIVAGMGKQFNTMDLKKPYLLHKELGLGIAVVDPVLGLTYPSLAQQAIRRKLQMELLAEEMRVLYVALTRAREKLILVGSVRQLPKAIAKWCENAGHQAWELPDGDLAKAKTYLDWVMPAIARHQHGQILRKSAKIEDNSHITESITYQDPSAWQVHLWQPEDSLEIRGQVLDDQEDLLEKVLKLEPINNEADYQTIINERLTWAYPHEKVVAISAKTTVTELKRREAINEAYQNMDESIHHWQPKINSRPRFLQGTTQLTSSERGSAIHLVMQHLKLAGEITPEVIKEQIAQMIVKELLTSEQGEVIDVRAIANFFKQPHGQRVLEADKVHRELPFILAIDAKLIHQELDSASEEKVLIQGVIDCLIEEEDGLVLIDYKTDGVKNPAQGQEELIEKYQSQLDLYTQAIERIIKKPVKEKYIYSFTLNSFIAC
jgi:ATP-dependent helicase/nuclease subunit A